MLTSGQRTSYLGYVPVMVLCKPLLSLARPALPQSEAAGGVFEDKVPMYLGSGEGARILVSLILVYTKKNMEL